MNKKQIVIIIGGLLTANAFAQAPLPVNPAVVQPQAPKVEAPAVVQAPVLDISKSNALEKEVTPLLREISRKKAVLELKKLDREIEKLDEEALKAQADREKAAAPVSSAPTTGPMGGVVPGLYNPTVMNPGSLPNASSGNSSPFDGNIIKVLMVYGFEDNLFAKVASGKQGGYVIKKGDIMPDGRVVVDIKQNYIEVSASRANKSAANTERIFVTSSSSDSKESSSNGNQGSASLPSATPPGGFPSAVTVIRDGSNLKKPL